MIGRYSAFFPLLIGVATAVACRERSTDSDGAPSAGSSEHTNAAEASAAVAASPSAAEAARPDASASARPPSSAADGSIARPGSCPQGMVPIPGGKFWVGSPDHGGIAEESPRFETEIAPFCLDRTEVTVEDYARCVKAGSCQPAHGDRRFCNVNWEGRQRHPINCVDWHQAVAYCKAEGARLPTEFEWEFAARGGSEYRKYPWGDAPPDGRTCWKHPGGSCEVGQYGEGAFGLHDITGNVWEWTESWYGKYPWPPLEGRNKVYRGGSWSRRFEKWMRPRLRNRWRPDQWGSHLGFRCASTPPGTKCPFGRREDGAGGCLHGITSIDCPTQQTWNGVRCVREGDPKCAPGRREEPGHGCVLEAEAKGKVPQTDLSLVSRSRSAGFDGDCAEHYPGRPHAYRYSGGTHHARNVVSHRAGCSNRDVGVGWNSCCCP